MAKPSEPALPDDGRPGDSPPRTGSQHPNRLDWMVADLQGEHRDLAWYVERGKTDKDAARRALQLCVQSLSDAALAQNGGLPSVSLRAALREILGPAAETGDSLLLKAARGKPGQRSIDSDGFNRMWWWAVEMHRLISAKGLAQEAAAEEAMQDHAGEPGVPDAATVAKAYRKLRPAVLMWLADTEK